MTSPEHTLVGILGAFSLGLHHRLGWTAVAFAALVSNIPDLDGLPMLVDMERFEAGHRVWGHNLFAIAITTLIVALTQFRSRWIERVAMRSARFLPSDVRVADEPDRRRISLKTWITIGLLFQCVHLVCDITVSGGNGLSDWHVKPFWPFSESGYVFPLIPWGDIGPTVIMMLGIIGIAKMGNAKRVSTVALGTLCVYMLARGYARGVFQTFNI